jgi:hypothetical protein
MTDDQADEVIARFVNEQWDAWVGAGGLDAVEEVLGPVKTEPAHRIFEAGWKLGAEHFIQAGRRAAGD